MASGEEIVSKMMEKRLILAGGFPYIFPEAMAFGGPGLLLASGLASVSPLGILGALASQELPAACLARPLPAAAPKDLVSVPLESVHPLEVGQCRLGGTWKKSSPLKLSGRLR